VSIADGQTYGRILKTSALLGCASLIHVLLGIVRVKVLAVQLGPEFYGQMALYSGLTGIIGAVVSLGIGQGAVREIAAAVGSGDQRRVSATVAVLRRLVWITGLIGLLVTVVLAYPASWWTFDSPDYAWGMAALGITVLFTQLQSGQNAILSGFRKIRELAAINIVGGVWSTILAIPILLIFREQGIVPFLLAVAAGQLAASWWYARRVPLSHIQLTQNEFQTEARVILGLGITMVAAGVVVSASAYAIQLILLKYVDEAAVGLYQSAFTISGIYVGFILQAMSGDYYPRLAGVSEDRAARNRLVQEQSEMAILLAIPGLVGSLVFSELLILLLYSHRFDGAAGIFHWQTLGLLGRIVSWPLGFIFLARNDRWAFFFSELATAGVHVAAVWVAVNYYGMVGGGIGFAVQYLFYIACVCWITRVRHGYVWERSTLILVLTGTLFVGLAFGSTYITDVFWRYGAGGLLTFASAIWSVYGLVQRIGRERINARIRKFRSWFRW